MDLIVQPVDLVDTVAVPDDFLVARNPDASSSLPYLVRVPLGREGVVLKVRETWPRTAKVYCHPSEDWPAEPDIVERLPVRSCVRRGVAVDLVLERGREKRSQFVFTRARGREVVFWQSARTARKARPGLPIPSMRASGFSTVEILVDAHERYPFRFAKQKASTTRRGLTSGDYAVEFGGTIVASVERKSLEDLTSSLLNGRLRFAMTELSTVPRAAVVIEDRYAALFRMEHVSGGTAAEALAEMQVRFPTVPIVFCDSRPLAEEWTFRFLAAALAQAELDATGAERVAALPAAGAPPRRDPTPAELRTWAREHGMEVSDRGRIPSTILRAFLAAES